MHDSVWFPLFATIGIFFIVGFPFYLMMSFFNHRDNVRRYVEGLTEERDEIMNKEVHDLARTYKNIKYFNYRVSQGPPKKPLWLRWTKDPTL